MFVESLENKININVSDLVFVASRKRELFLRLEKALIDPPDFAIGVSKREDEARGRTYYSGVNLSCSFKVNEILLEIAGKISVSSEGDNFAVDVVKSIRYPIKLVNEDFAENWISEGKIYAFILAKKRKLTSVTVRISVFHTETLSRRNIIKNYSIEELDSFFRSVVAEFYKFSELIVPHVKSRNSSEEKIAFPFKTPRSGQKEISKEIYSAIKNKQNAIINAPTGIGKTVSALYPALKAQGKGLCNKIFFLTAKNSGNEAALAALKAFRDVGCDLFVLVVSAKSKICDNPCTPKHCFISKGHDQRMISALLEVVSAESFFTKDVILKYAKKHSVCPFMLQTELALFADVVVCDYNYIFDSDISCKLSTALSGNDVFLIDEAHNVVDRLRNVFSERIDVKSLLKLSEKIESSSNLNKTIKGFLKYLRNDIQDSDFSCEPLSCQSVDGLERELNRLLSDFQEHFEEKRDAEEINALEVYSLSDSLRSFVDFLTLRSDDYIVFYNDDQEPEIFLVDTSKTLLNLSKKLGSFVMLSATLFPEEYYKYMLGNTKSDSYVSIDSPFNFENFLVLAYPLSTKFSERESTVVDVVSAIFTAGTVKKGNYISFFPSYEYMMLAVNKFKEMYPEEYVHCQVQGMDDKSREDFLSAFDSSPKRTMYAFAVLGGAFSEGVDLVGEKLSGAIVVGLGSLPPSRKSAIISQYFSDLFFDGEKFAYHYPGLNKVFQAGGRVIRSETDKGFLVIIDDRFLTEDNIELLPDNWKNLKRVKGNNEVLSHLKNFWQIL